MKKLLLGFAVLILVGVISTIALAETHFLENNPLRIEVENITNTPRKYQLLLKDWGVTEEGELYFRKYGTLSRSLKLQCSPASIILQPGEKASFWLFSEEVEETKWAWLFLKMSPIQGTEDNTLKISPAIDKGSIFKFAPESAKAGIVTAISKTEEAIIVEFQNTGEKPMWATGKVEIISKTGTSTTIGEIEPFFSLPGETRVITVINDGKIEFPKPYQILATFDFGGDYIVGGQRVVR